MDKSATDAEVRRRYIELAKRHHPDVGGSDNQMRRINEAYAALRRGTDRTEYDKQHDLHHETDDMQQYVDDIEEYMQQTYAAPASGRAEHGSAPPRSPFGRALKLALGVSVAMVIGVFGVSLASALKKGGTTPVAAVSSTDKGVAPAPLTGVTVPEYTPSGSRSTVPPSQTQPPAQNQPTSAAPQATSPSGAVPSTKVMPANPASTSDLPGSTCRSLRRTYPHRHIECPAPAD